MRRKTDRGKNTDPNGKQFLAKRIAAKTELASRREALKANPMSLKCIPSGGGDMNKNCLNRGEAQYFLGKIKRSSFCLKKGLQYQFFPHDQDITIINGMVSTHQKKIKLDNLNSVCSKVSGKVLPLSNNKKEF